MAPGRVNVLREYFKLCQVPANARCSALTNGCGYVRLIQALENYFKAYVNEFRRVLTNLREKCRFDSSMEDSEDWTLFQQSLRIIQTCGELIMHTDELDQTLVSDIVNSLSKFVIPTSPLKETTTKFESKKNPFHNYSLLLLSRHNDRQATEALITKLEEGDTPSVLEDFKAEMCRLSEEVHKLAFDIVFTPLDHQLGHLPTMEIWMSESAGGAITSNLPTFSLSPQEYITKIGQYLMTLPQQLEPFTMQDNPAVMVALKHGKLPYTNEQELPEHLADLWIESIARGTMHIYCEQVLKIHELTPHATRQLVTDLDYLANILDDLGLQTSEQMLNLAALLKATEEEFHETANKMPQRLASAVGDMRNIHYH